MIRLSVMLVAVRNESNNTKKKKKEEVMVVSIHPHGNDVQETNVVKTETVEQAVHAFA